MGGTRKRFGEVLVDSGIVAAEEIEAALVEQDAKGGLLGSILLGRGALSQEYLLRTLSGHLGLKAVFTDEYPKEPPDLGVELSPVFLRANMIVPLEKSGNVVCAASAYPQDPYPAQAMEAATGLKVDVVIGLEKDIVRAIDALFSGPGSAMDRIIEGIDEKGAEPSGSDDVEHLRDMALEAPVVNLVNLLITKAVEKRASDIHIEPFQDSVRVRYRIDGVLHTAETLPKRLQPAIISRIKIMAKLNIAERRLPQDGRIMLRAGDKEVDVRVSTLASLYGEGVVLRLLDATGVVTLEDVGFPEAALKAFESLILQPHGMVLVTGPTGSGKSTTLYAALSRIDTSEKKVITIEDPVEYNIPGVNQIQVKPKIGFTFANGLRSIVRQDPDVIMVGEIRDAETADIAVHSALTGHLILSTLHTNDAPGAVTRLMDMGIEGYLISSSLLAVLAQRLVRVICPRCKVPCAPTKNAVLEAHSGGFFAGAAAGSALYRGEGCEECSGTGYRGRTGIFELMPVTDSIRKLIVERKGSDVIMEKAIEEGMVTLREDGMDKVLKGITTIEEVARVTLSQ